MDNAIPRIAVAIETSSDVGSVALVADDRVLVEHSFARGLRHGTDLVPALDAIVRSASIDTRRVTLIVVGTGPGSYTGLRVGLASAKALAFALKVPLVGLPSSDAAVCALPPLQGRSAAVLVDAKRDYVYLSSYAADGSRWNLLDAHRILPPARAVEAIPQHAVLIGDGALRYRDIFLARGLAVLDDVSAVPAAGWVGKLGVRKFVTSRTDELLTVEPLYLRLSEAEERRPVPRSPGPQSTT